MVGTETSGNPNIAAISKAKSTGPTSEIGKMKSSLNAVKYTGTAAQRDQLGYSKIKDMMEEAGIDFSKAEAAAKKRNIFEIWFKSNKTTDLNAINNLDTVIRLLEDDMYKRVIRKQEEGLNLNDQDLRVIKLLKESLEAYHKLKYGDKHLHAHVGYEDIRKMMFGDKDSNP